MKTFIRKVCIFFCIISTVTVAVNVWYKRNENIIDADYTEKFKHIPEFIQVCNFGSSHGKWDYNYEDVIGEGYSCFNFGLGSQTLSYDYILMQRYGDRIGNGTIVFINISYFSLFGEDEEINCEFQSKNKRYYKILPNSMIKNYDWKTDAYVNYFPALASDNLVGVLLGKPVNTTESLWDRMTTEKELDQNVYQRYLDHVAVNVDEKGKRIVNAAEMQALESMIGFCKDKGSLPILITPPYTDRYIDAIGNNDEAFYGDFSRLIKGVEDEYGVEYYDYSADERFCSDYTLFMDQDHMNRNGALLYTNTLFEEVIAQWIKRN